MQPQYIITTQSVEYSFQNFINELLVQQNNRDKYVESVRESMYIPTSLLRKIQEVYKNLINGKIESNFEIAIENDKPFIFDPYTISIYNAGLNNVRIPTNRIIVYSVLNDDYFSSEELAFIENNQFLLAIRITSKGGLLMYGKPSLKLNNEIAEQRDRMLAKFGDIAWTPGIDGYPEWYSNLKSINLKSKFKDTYKNLWDFSKKYQMPIFLSKYSLDYYYVQSIKIFKEEIDINTIPDFSEFNFMKMIKVSKKGNLYKDMWEDIKM